MENYQKLTREQQKAEKAFGDVVADAAGHLAFVQAATYPPSGDYTLFCTRPYKKSVRVSPKRVSKVCSVESLGYDSDDIAALMGPSPEENIICKGDILRFLKDRAEGLYLPIAEEVHIGDNVLVLTANLAGAPAKYNGTCGVVCGIDNGLCEVRHLDKEQYVYQRHRLRKKVKVPAQSAAQNLSCKTPGDIASDTQMLPASQVAFIQEKLEGVFDGLRVSVADIQPTIEANGEIDVQVTFRGWADEVDKW